MNNNSICTGMRYMQDARVLASRVSERPEASSDHQGIKLNKLAAQENAHGSSHATDGGMENRNGSLALAADWRQGGRVEEQPSPPSLCSLYMPRSQVALHNMQLRESCVFGTPMKGASYRRPTLLLLDLLGAHDVGGSRSLNRGKLVRRLRFLTITATQLL